MSVALYPNSGSMIDTETWETYRRYLFAIAYRMLGSASEAEDIVQDAYLRSSGSNIRHAESTKAYLATIVTRLCLDHLRSARVNRETYIGPWLPDPVPTDHLTARLVDSAERRDQLSLAFLLMLERLTPEERAVYVLREAFDYSHGEIADMLGKPVATIRQHAHRARERVQSDRRRFVATPERHRELVDRFVDATRSGDLESLTELLTDDVVAWTDGGPARQAARRPIVGADAVARGLIGAVNKFFGDARPTIEDLNGGLALLLWDGAELRIAITFELTETGKIAGLRSVLNPEKLAYLLRYVDGRGGSAMA